MKKNRLLLLGAVLLALLGIGMIALGLRASILPPSLTGLGFLVIAFVFLGLRNH